MNNAILYQAYGGTDFINECKYSLLKYLQVYNLSPPGNTGIYIYTDQPHLFSDFLPFFAGFECIPVQEAMINQWKGTAGFVHRFKIEMIRDFFQRFDGNLLYCDTDTYVTAPLEPLFQDIENGAIFMHEYEGVIDKTQFPSFHKWEKFLSSTPIEYNGKQVQFSKQLQMFNAGVIGTNAKRKDVLDDVLALSDSVYAKFPKHIAEQFAFSYCLQKAGTINTANHLLSHYWNLKEFRQLLQRFFAKNLEESIPNLVKKVHHLDALSIMQEKMAFNSLPALQRIWKSFTGAAWQIGRYESKL